MPTSARSAVGIFPAISPNGRVVLGTVALLLAVLAAYYPAIGNGYVWDDDAYLTNNPLITAPDGLRRIWFSLDSPSQYFPLVYTTFRAEHALWGLNPAGYHLVNILLHAVNACLVWVILGRLAVPGAWLAAALFALHPVQVESVAWVTERKNVLSTVFFLAALLSWLRFAETEGAGRWRPYVLSLGFCWLALFSKTTTCTLPAALLVICWLRGERLSWKRVLETLPFAVSGLVMGAVSIWWERYHQGTFGPQFTLEAGQRLLVAGRAFWFYLGKLAWPAKLAFSYPRWTVDAGDWRQWLWPAGLAALGAALWLRRRGPGNVPLAAFLFFISTLAPLLGFISLYTFRYTFVADHYQYVACLGPLTLLAAAHSRRWARPLPDLGLRLALPLAILLASGYLTWSQCRVYRSDETLWRDTIAKSPGSAIARHNLGVALAAGGKLEEAAQRYRESLRLEPGNIFTLANLGNVLLRQGRLDEAARHYQAALRIEPSYADAHYNLGVTLYRGGNADGALEHFLAAVRLNPRHARAHNNLGAAFQGLGRMREAVEQYRVSLGLDPDNAEAHNNLGAALAALGATGEAAAEYRAALRIRPDYAQARKNLEQMLNDAGRGR